MALAVWGFITVFVLLAATLSRKVSPLIALFAIPVCTALAAGFGAKTGVFILDGIRSIAPVIGMFVFAILFFGVLTEAGMIEPMIKFLVRKMGKRPIYIVPCSALLALLVHLDGSGAVVFLVTVPALLAIYDRVGIQRKVLACAVSLAAGVNFLPWTGPVLRASAALHIPVMTLFRPLIPVQVVGLIFVFIVTVRMGVAEERRLSPAIPALQISEMPASRKAPPRWLFRLNILLVTLVLGSAIGGLVDPMIVFMAGTMIALLLNFPTLTGQHGSLTSHAHAAILMCCMLFSAGSFSGIMRGTGMLNSMANASARHIPQHSLTHLPFILGLIAMPLSLLFDPDSFYFGLLPVLAGIAAPAGVPSLQVAQGALLGQMTTGFPVSPLTPATFLVVGLSEVSLAEHQRFAGPYLFAASVVMTFAAVLFGVFKL